MTDPLLGKVIGQRYRLETRLGTGAMGDVFRARHLLIDREVAIKVLRVDRRDQRHYRAWFLREARAVNRVNHPNIADIYDFGDTEDGLAYLVMELVHGELLSDRIDRGRIPVSQSLDVIQQMAAALGRAHDLGVIHRDLKPENVMLVNRGGRSEFVKLIDFGLARMATEASLAAKGAVFGTPGYLSPEQARGEDVGPQSDLYALGLVLFEMLTGRPVFGGQGEKGIEASDTQHPPPPLSKLRKEVDPAVEHIILKLLAPDLDERYRDAYHVIDDCEAAMRAVGTARRRISDPPAAAGPPQPTTEVLNSVSAWALRAAVFGRMAATCYPGGNGPPRVTEAIATIWQSVAALSRLEGELQVTQSWDDNLRSRSREFAGQLGRRIEDLSRSKSSLLREIAKGRDELERHRSGCSRSFRELAGLRIATAKAESAGKRDELWKILQAAGAEAAREQVHLNAIALLEQKMAKWTRAIQQVESQSAELRRQLDRHASQVESDLELGRPRFTTLLSEREKLSSSLAEAARLLSAHFESRPECTALLSELEAISAP